MDIQDTIDKYNRECRKILHQKLIIKLVEMSNGYYLQRKYEFQEEIIKWTPQDINMINESLIDRGFIVERPLRYDNDYLCLLKIEQIHPPSYERWTDDPVQLVSNLYLQGTRDKKLNSLGV
jgi:hypothetical protein